MGRLFTFLTDRRRIGNALRYAQLATTTSLVGTVSDASGKTVPGAKVTADQHRHPDTYTATTTEQGYYNFPFVAIGDYRSSGAAGISGSG